MAEVGIRSGGISTRISSTLCSMARWLEDDPEGAQVLPAGRPSVCWRLGCAPPAPKPKRVHVETPEVEDSGLNQICFRISSSSRRWLRRILRYPARARTPSRPSLVSGAFRSVGVRTCVGRPFRQSVPNAAGGVLPVPVFPISFSCKYLRSILFHMDLQDFAMACLVCWYGERDRDMVRRGRAASPLHRAVGL